LRLCDVIDWLDTHNGSMTLVATIALVLVTYGYVRLTGKLAQFQQVPLKREIIDEVYPRVERMIESVTHYGRSPQDLFDEWGNLRHYKAYLVYTPLFPLSVCRLLDRLTDDPNRTFAVAYESLYEAANGACLQYGPRGEQPPTPGLIPGVNGAPLVAFVMEGLATAAPILDSLTRASGSPDKDQALEWVTAKGGHLGDEEIPAACRDCGASGCRPPAGVS